MKVLRYTPFCQKQKVKGCWHLPVPFLQIPGVLCWIRTNWRKHFGPLIFTLFFSHNTSALDKLCTCKVKNLLMNNLIAAHNSYLPFILFHVYLLLTLVVTCCHILFLSVFSSVWGVNVVFLTVHTAPSCYLSYRESLL